MITPSATNFRRLVGGVMVCWLICGPAWPACASSPAPPDDGVVVDEAGQPVAGATVESIYGRLQPARTDADGRFTFADRAAIARFRSLAVVARAADGRLGYLASDNSGKRPVRVMVKPARSVQVRAVDGTGQPVEGADVIGLSSYAVVSRGQTDIEGRATIAMPADSPAWKCLARKAKVGFDYAQAERARGSGDPPLPLPATLTLILDGAAPPVAVRAVDLQDHGLAGVEVGPWLLQKEGHEADINLSLNTFEATTTGPDGVATLDWLPARVVNGYSIVAHSPTAYAIDHAVHVKGTPGEPVARLVMAPFERVAGRVVDAAGRPVADAEVKAHSSGGGSNYFSGQVRTDADGRYEFPTAYTEQAYIFTATKGDEAAPYNAGLVLRPGQPLAGVNFTLGPSTKLAGRVTTGTDGQSVPDLSFGVAIDRGAIPAELKRPGDRFYRPLQSYEWVKTDADGRYEIRLGPGEYEIRQLPRVEPIKFTISPADRPATVVRDIVMPRPDKGPFELTVKDPQGRPAAQAKLGARYISPVWVDLPKPVTDAAGRIAFERSLDPMILHVVNADGTLGAVSRFEVDATQGEMTLKPTATLAGRLVGVGGQPLANTKFQYGIKVHTGPKKNSPFSWHFGGVATTDAAGQFACPGLVVGESYQIFISNESEGRTSTAQTDLLATGPGPLAVGDVVIDLTPYVPYTPPTPAELAREAFAGAQSRALADRLQRILVEAKREYTVPLILFGTKDDPACIDLFRLFKDSSSTEEKTQPATKTPMELRWDFELLSLDTTQAEVAPLAARLGVDPKTAPPVLVVLDEAGQPVASYHLRLGTAGKLDAGTLGSFLQAHALPTRDAQALLASAQAQGRADGKPTFLILSASWCGPCRLLARFLDAHKPDFEPYFHFVKLDISRDDHADDLRKRFPESSQSGVPWYVILDPAGKSLANSNRFVPTEDDDRGNPNIGFPSEPEGVDHFLRMLRAGAPTMPPALLDRIRAVLMSKP